jgi:hypothetical protein
LAINPNGFTPTEPYSEVDHLLIENAAAADYTFPISLMHTAPDSIPSAIRTMKFQRK